MEKVNMVPGFILKLWKMINDSQCDDLISWSENGKSFIITDPPRFSQELSKYFKHNNLSSFIRQLNMYGFRKVASIENTGLDMGTDDLHFYHPDFIRDKPDRLEAIKRKLPQKIAETVDLRNVIKGITEIEDKQNNVSQTLSDIKRENEMLWSELHDLRQKHQQQQLYISRLMKLVFEAMEQNGIKKNMLYLKRNSPLMIEGGEGNAHIAKKTKLNPPNDSTNTLPYSGPATSYQIPSPIDQFTNAEEQCLDSAEYATAQLEEATTSINTPSRTPTNAEEYNSLDPSLDMAQQNVDQLQTLNTPRVDHAALDNPEGQLDIVNNVGLLTNVHQNIASPKTDRGASLTDQSRLDLPADLQQPDGSQQLFPDANVDSSYRTLEETINCNGDQIDSLVPSIMDFDDANIDDFFAN